MKRYHYYSLTFLFLFGVVGLSPAHAASLVNSATCYLSGGSPCTISITNTSGDLLWVGINEYGMSDTLSVSDTAGNVYTVASPYENSTNGNSPQLIQTFYSANIRGGSNTITCTRGSSGGSGRCVVLEYSGIATSSPLDGQQESPEENVIAYTSGNFATTNNTDLLIGYFASRNSGGSWTPESGWTTITTNSVDFDIFVEAESTVSSGVYSATAGYSSASWGVGAVDAFRLAASGGSGGSSPTSTPPTTGSPTIPTSLTVSGVTAASVSLSWSASTEQGGTGSVSGYEIYRNGSQVSTTGGTTYTDSGLTAGTTYTYTIAAYDTNGNTSSPSAGVQGTTTGSAGTSGSHTYYVSYSTGSDSWDGLEKVHTTGSTGPWQHAPGMQTCAAVCASTTINPGDSIILEGGVTWPNSSFAWNLPGGSSGSPVYIGVDKTWYAGSVWARPILNAGGVAIANNYDTMFNVSPNVTIDDFEITGFYWSNTACSGAPYGACGIFNAGQRTGQTFENLYIHGWTHAGSGGATSNGVADVFSFGGYGNTVAHNNVIVGTDVPGDHSMTVFFDGPSVAYDNYIQQVSSAFIDTNPTSIHDNYIDDIGPAYCNTPFPQYAGYCSHENGFEDNGDEGLDFYNNVVTDVSAGLAIWIAPNPGYTATMWNNLIYAIHDNQILDFAQPVYNSAYCNSGEDTSNGYCNTAGNFVFDNNTVEFGDDTTLNPISLGGAFMQSQVYQNNHFIASSATGGCAPGLSTCTFASNVIQTLSTANAQGYSSVETYPFSPTGGGSTVGAGTNLTGSCSGVMASLCDDTTLGVGLDTANDTVIVPDRTPNTRPSSGVWDTGAYEYTNAGGSVPPPTQPPLVSISAPVSGATASGTISISGVASDNVSVSSVSISIDGGAYQSVQGTTSWFYSLNTTSLTNGSHTITAEATDPAANIGISPTVTITVSNVVTPPTTPTGLSVSGTTTSTVTLAWTASTQGTYGIAGYKIYRCTGTCTPTTQIGTSTLPGGTDTSLAPNTTYTYAVQAYDSQGNVSGMSSAVQGTTKSVADTTPPTVPTGLQVTGTTTSTVSLSWTASTDNVGVAGYKIYRNSTEIGTTTATSFTNTGLNQSTTYSYTVSAYDAAGNNSAQSSAVQGTTKFQDTTPPTVSVTTPPNGAMVSSAVTLAANATDNVAVASVQFRVDGTLVGTPITTSPYTFSWNTASVANGSHSVTAIAKDTSNNQTISPAITITVANAPPADTTPPTVPTGLQVTGTTTSTVSLSWTASTDNVGVAGYKIYRGGIQVGTTQTTSFTDTGLTPGTTYQYAISAYDAAGNNSAQSGLVSDLTQALPLLTDTTPPAIAITTPTNNEVVAGTVAIQGTASDNVSVASVWISIDGGGYVSVMATSSWTHSLDTTQLPNGNHTITAEAADPSGNTNSTAIVVNIENSSVSGGGGGSSGGSASEGGGGGSGSGSGFIGLGGNGGTTVPTTASTTLPTSPSTIPTSPTALAALLQSLLTELNALIAQLNQGLVATFTRNLTIGSSGADVKNLQVFLNDNGYPVATSGAGSPGDESLYFGAKTAAALAKWQKANGLPDTGYFGDLTRQYLQGKW